MTAAVQGVSAQRVAALLREGLASGDFAALADAYADDVLLDMNVVGRRRRGRGAVAAVELLSSLFVGPGRLREWSPRVHADGLALWFERLPEAGPPLRQRHYLRLRDGSVDRHWGYSAPPRSSVGEADVLFDPALAAMLGQVVRHEPVVSSGWSGNAIERLVLADGRRLIAKRIVPGRAWIDQHTKDDGREALLFTSGVLHRLPDTVDPAVVAVERDGEAWWVLMRDVSDSLLPDGARLSREEHHRILTAANRMWEEFWGEAVPHVCSLHDCFQLFSPRIGEAERDGVDLLPKQYAVFWEAFGEAVDPDVGDAVLSLVEDPAPLVAALDSRGTTLIHADIRDEQIGLEGDRLILLDWGRASQGHPVVDFFWSICHNGWRVDASHDQLVEDFRRVRGEHDDPEAVELGVIAGLMMYGWVFGHSAAYHPDPAEREWARAELSWWVPRARSALELL